MNADPMKGQSRKSIRQAQGPSPTSRDLDAKLDESIELAERGIDMAALAHVNACEAKEESAMAHRYAKATNFWCICIMAAIIIHIILSATGVCADLEVERVERVIDGDTVVLWTIQRYQLDPDTKSTVSRRFTVRIDGLDTYETRRIRRKDGRVTEQEVEKGLAATKALEEILRSRAIRIRTDYETGPWGRLVGRLLRYNRPTGEWQDVTELMIAAGHDRRKEHQHGDQ